MTDKNEQLLKSLAGGQVEACKYIHWLYYGARGVGRTHLLCTLAVMEAIDGREGIVIDHSPYNLALGRYVVGMIHKIAASVEVEVVVTERPVGCFRVKEKNPVYKP